LQNQWKFDEKNDGEFFEFFQRIGEVWEEKGKFRKWNQKNVWKLRKPSEFAGSLILFSIKKKKIIKLFGFPIWNNFPYKM